ncbi:hypothetical protein GCM10023115_37140 [Pontixanthobacter gangjinensis]
MVFHSIAADNIFVSMDTSLKELVKKDKDFEKEYLAAKESILFIGLCLLALSAILIVLIIIFF